MELRPYQKEAICAISDQWREGRKRTLLVLPTGTGKTVVFAALIGEVAQHGKRSLVLAHRGELLEQAAEKIEAVTGLMCATEKAEQTSIGSMLPVTVGSVQTLMRDSRLSLFAPDYFDFIIVDEAHHAMADSYRKILDHFGGAYVLGVTATPDRTDRQNLGAYFDSLAYEYTLPKAISDGYLCPIKALTIPLNIDISSVKQSNGDYSLGDLGSALDPYLDAIADEIAATCRDRHTVVFLPLVATSQHFRDILLERGISAAEVNGDSADRAEVLADFAAGRYQVLCNSMLLTEGWDCPSVDCIVVLRATRSRSLYAQMVGRGTRLSPGKDNLLLLDFLWHTATHELCRPAYLIAPNKDIEQRMTKTLNGAQMAMDLETLEQDAETQEQQAREEALAAKLAEMRHRKRKLVDPLQFEMSIADADLASYVPTFAWELEPATQKQLDALESFGIDSSQIECKGKASLYMDKLVKRRKSGLSTPKQIKCLERYGFQRVGMWSFDEANKIIGSISHNGWVLPRNIKPSEYVPDSLKVAL